MPKRKFKASTGLVEKVATKQSGVIEKAWLEAVMNSVDAGADLIELLIEEGWSDISDNGDSMTKEEVQTYFEQFGLEDSDIEDKEFGKFRIGRGQIFNFGVNIWRAKENYMVVSLDDREVTANLEECTTEEDESIIDVNDSIYQIDTDGLGYALLDAEPIDEGLNIHVDHYNPIEDLESTISDFKSLVKYVSWVHDVTIKVNGEEVGQEPEVIEETDNAWFIEAKDRYTDRSTVYNKGAKVDTFNLGPRRLAIITKKDLDVTLDRTDILETDEYWQTIQGEYRDVIIQELLSDDDLSFNERNWLIEEASQDVGLIKMIQGKPILKDIEGDSWTINQLATKKLGFAQRDDNVAEEANSDPRVVMLREKHKDSLKKFTNSAQDTIEQSNVKKYSDIVDENLAFEMNEVSPDDLSKRRRSNLKSIREALLDLGFSGDVKAGYSNHKDVWKDDEETLYIHKNSLNCSKEEIATEVFFNVVIVASHTGDTRAGMNEDYGLKDDFYQMVTGDNFRSDIDYPEAQRRLLNGHYK